MFFLQSLYIKYQKIISYILIPITFICCYATYIILSTTHNSINSKLLFVMLYIDIILLILISFLLIHRIRRLFKFGRKKKIGNMFHKQIITLFSIVTITPSLCVFVFSAMFFNIGIENLFKAPVNKAMDDANQVVAIYNNEMEMSMAGFACDISNRISELINNDMFFDPKTINNIISEENAILKRNIIVMQENVGIIAKSN